MHACVYVCVCKCVCVCVCVCKCVFVCCLCVIPRRGSVSNLLHVHLPGSTCKARAAKMSLPEGVELSAELREQLGVNGPAQSTSCQHGSSRKKRARAKKGDRGEEEPKQKLSCRQRKKRARIEEMKLKKRKRAALLVCVQF